MDRGPEALLGDDDVTELVGAVSRAVHALFPADQVDFLAPDGDLDGLGAGHVSTAALNVLRDDLETPVLGSGQDVGADALEGVGHAVEGGVVGVSRGAAHGC